MNRFQDIFAQMMQEGNVKLATEAEATTESVETEIIVYCKIGNFNGLQKASHIEHQEQLETEFKNGTRCRVRSIQHQNSDDIKYEFTFKVKTDANEGCEANTEHTVEVGRSFCEGFKAVADHYVKKVRYEFASSNIFLTFVEGGESKTVEIPDVKYEVDVYIDKDSKICEWCKIDIEIDTIINYLGQHHPELKDVNLKVRISHLPFQPTDTILALTANPEQKAFIDALWKDHWQLPIVNDQGQ